MKLTISLTKISPTHHRFEYLRDNGTGEKLELETKTFLFHDLLHFAVETEAGLKNSFYGLLLKSGSYAALSDDSAMQEQVGGEIGLTERVVGSLTGFLKGGATPESFLLGMKSWLAATGDEVPRWLDKDFLERIKHRMRALMGEWNSAPFGQTMRLEFEL